jgi:hypothetical protein
VRRITPESTLDESWATRRFESTGFINDWIRVR